MMLRNLKRLPRFIQKQSKFLPSVTYRNAHTRIMDGNEAAAHIAYQLSDTCFIYPITPASQMGEHIDEYCAQGKTNLFGEKVNVYEMQSEGGASGAVHGSLATGCLTSTFTSSQGLLLMIPNMFKIAGEGLPGVLHVSSRSLSKHAISVLCDHSDVMAVRSTGFAILGSSSPQEAMDLALVSHLSALKARVPFVHFFDGFRTSHEIQKIQAYDVDEIRSIVDMDLVKEFRKTGFNPEHPTYRGYVTNDDVFWQWNDQNLTYMNKVPEVVEEYMKKVEKLSGRKYNLYDYYGHPEAEHVIVIMGSSAKTVAEVVEYLNKKGEKVGCVQVRLFRPFAKEKFYSAIPKSAKRITVLDRVREQNSEGQPLYQDVVVAFNEKNDTRDIIPGIYGIGGKDFTPGMVMSVFNNMKQEKPKMHFTIGIIDDKFNSSLPLLPEVDTAPEGTKQYVFYGIGGDGTVGANQEAIAIIGENTDYYSQAYFTYEAKKSNGYTISNLRFSKEPIQSEYEIQFADYVAVHNPSYVKRMPVLKKIKEGGVFVLNSSCKNLQEIEEFLPDNLKKTIAEKKVKFYNIDASGIAEKIGIKGRINMIMQSVFFKLADIMDIEKAKEALKQGVLKNYGLKGEKVVQLNYAAIDAGFSDSNLMEVKYPASWANIDVKPAQKVETKPQNEHEAFVQKIFNAVHEFKGNELPVSAFDDIIAGQTPTGTSKYEKRGVANNIPMWNKEKCIKCNICSFVCPQAAIRPFLMTDEEAKKAEELGIEYLKGVKQTKDYHFRVQVSPLDCLDCGVCVRECPREGALQMTSVKDIDVEKEAKKWDYLVSLPSKGEEFKTNTIVGSQFQTPLLEFTGACNGCPEATYMKVLTQLFGDRMMLANAAGCSIVWCGTFPSAAYTVNERGHGPSWGFSLFEDNAEYGFGMAIAAQQKRAMLKRYVQNMMAKNILPNEQRQLFQEWLDNFNKGPITKKLSLKINDWMTTEGQTLLVDSDFAAAYELRDMFTKPSVWIIGGDGFAYDIGSAGLDHVLSMDVDINVLVLDNQSYANTGFQMSKSTPYGTKAKFASLGKRTQKKDLGMTMMQYGHVYVAQIASGANMAQTLRALHEAEEHPGPSLVIAYCPCQGQGLSRGMSYAQTTMKEAVESGFWNIYRYDPKKEKPFTLDSKELKRSVKDFLKNEVRYSSLMIQHPELAKELQEELERQCIERFNKLKKLEASQ